MAKNYIIFIFPLFLSFTVCPVNDSRLTREQVARTFLNEVGVQEETGNNDGPRIESYLKITGLGKGFPYCAAFVAWVYTRNHIPNPRSAWSPDWFPEKNVIYTNRPGIQETIVPDTGDVFGIYFPEKGRIAHVGFILTWGKQVTTVEGNTSADGGRDGDGVYKKYRLKTQIYKVSRWLN